MLDVSGLDDAQDDVRWLIEHPLSSGASVEIRVQEAARVDAPTRRGRRKRNWPAYFQEMRLRDRRRLRVLKKRLALLRAGRLAPPARFPARPSAFCLEVKLNGRQVACISAAAPGSVYAAVVIAKGKVGLELRGWENVRVGQRSLRWGDRRLKTGDVVRVALKGGRATTPRDAELVYFEAWTQDEIERQIQQIRSLNPKSLAAEMRLWEQERPPARKYPRGKRLHDLTSASE